MVTPMMRDSGETSLIWRVASIPEKGTMLISMSTTFGCFCLLIFTASSEFAQDPITLNRESRFRIKVQVSLISLWSSAIKILIISGGFQVASTGFGHRFRDTYL